MPAFINDANKAKIDEQIRSYCTGISKYGWSMVADEDKNILNNELSAICDSYFGGVEESQDANKERVYKTLMNLWHKDNLYSFKGDSK
jgi:beta-mannanase